MSPEFSRRKGAQKSRCNVKFILSRNVLFCFLICVGFFRYAYAFANQTINQEYNTDIIRLMIDAEWLQLLASAGKTMTFLYITSSTAFYRFIQIWLPLYIPIFVSATFGFFESICV